MDKIISIECGLIDMFVIFLNAVSCFGKIIVIKDVEKKQVK